MQKKKSIFSFTIHDERIRIVLAIVCISVGIFFMLSFSSFLFTWQDDQSELLQKSTWSYLFSTQDGIDPAIGKSHPSIAIIEQNEKTTQNWGGKFGAVISKKFIHDWFGISSFLFVFISIIVGLKLFNISFFPVKRAVLISLLTILIVSITLGYVFGSLWDANIGGFFGYYVSHIFLAKIIGLIPAGLFVFAVFISFVLFTFKNSLPFIKKMIGVTPLMNELEPLTDSVFENESSNQLSSLDAEKLEQKEEDDDSLSNVLAETITDDGFQVIDSRTEEESEDEPKDVENESRELDEMEVTNTLDNDNEQDFVPTTQLHDYDPTLDLSHYKLPHLDLLENHKKASSEVSADELSENKKKIEDTLRNYNIEIDKISATIGPTITLYEIVPAAGIRISKIKSLEDDIALSLAALGIRIIAPIPGKGTIGIEVPNKNPETVSFRSVVASKVFQESKFDLPVALGKTISNETFVFDLTKTPHLLVAGATGQGKSVGLNAILASLLYKKHPSQLKLVLIDPKKVELTLYQNIEKHFLAKLPDEEEAIITDTHKVVATLNSLCVEMDDRYDLLKSAKMRNIKEYNEKFISRRLNPEKGHRYLPYIVVVVDEFADLIITAGKEIETPLMRLAQLARAIGIHLIIATQRPAANIITGGIKANFPSRIAFRVMSSIDSRTILDTSGANQLIGKGDMLITTGSNLVRLQCAFIDTPEIASLADYISEQQSFPSAYALPESKTNDASGGKTDDDLDALDSMFEDAARTIVLNQQGSTSLLQRKLKLGYNRAGRIMDQLEASGVVGPFEGSKARQVFIADETTLEQLLSNLKQQGKL